jgi:hypothetical protein
MPRKYMSRFRFSLLFAGVILVAAFARTYFLQRVPEVALPVNTEESIINIGVSDESVPAIIDPVFETVPAADGYLQNDGQGIVLIDGKQAKFFPFQILVWHNLVNDFWNGSPILVVYDPLCGGAAVFERNNDSQVFVNSGKIYNNSLLFRVSEAETLWSSFSGKILSGGSGELDKIPSLIMSWQNFRSSFPNGKVLSRETGSSRDYSENPYGSYSSSPDVWYPLTKYDSSLPAKTFVYGYGDMAFPKDNIKSSGRIIAETGIGKIAFVWDGDLETVRGFESEPDESLGKEIALSPAYWFCWVANTESSGIRLNLD